MEHNILRALHKNFLPKEMHEYFYSYLNWISDETSSCEVITDENLEYGKNETDREMLDTEINGMINTFGAEVNNSIKVLLEFMKKNNIQIILND